MRISLFNKLLMFCGMLLVLRFAVTQHFSFLFLFWNLFLAWLPLFITRRIRSSDTFFRKNVLGLMAIFFLPNAPYILTDLIHLKPGLAAPLWLDLILILSFALLGLFYFFLSAEKILNVFSELYGRRFEKTAKIFLIGATGYGIFLGRYLRFNTWDMVSNPVGLAKGVYLSLFELPNAVHTLSITLSFSVFLYLIFEIYLSFREKAAGNGLS